MHHVKMLHAVLELCFFCLNLKERHSSYAYFEGRQQVECFHTLTAGQTLVANLYANTGHGSKGWTLSFGSVQLLADIIDGKQPQVCRPKIILLRNAFLQSMDLVAD